MNSKPKYETGRKLIKHTHTVKNIAKIADIIQINIREKKQKRKITKMIPPEVVGKYF